MHPQLQSIADEFHEATARLDRLVHDTPPDRWSLRVDPARWSVGECVAHLNRTGRAFVPALESGIAAGRAIAGVREMSPAPGPTAVRGPTAAPRYRRDLLGWLLWRTMGPPVRMAVKTPASFVPEGSEPAAAVVAEFRRLQDEQLRLLAAADGLPLSRIRVASPFNETLGYNLYSAFSILPRHQHRHLWQAERARAGR
jgi:hypothetical protein